MVKNQPPNARYVKVSVQSLGWEDPLEKEMAIYSNILPGASQGQKSLMGCSPRDSKESDTTEQLSTYKYFGIFKRSINHTIMKLKLILHFLDQKSTKH